MGLVFFQIPLGLISETHLCSFAFHRVLLFVLIFWAIWKCRVSHVHKHRLGNAEIPLWVELSLQSLLKNYILGLNQPKLWSNTSRPCSSVSLIVEGLSLRDKWQITQNEPFKNRSWLASTSAAYTGATTTPVMQSLAVDPAALTQHFLEVAATNTVCLDPGSNCFIELWHLSVAHQIPSSALNTNEWVVGGKKHLSLLVTCT